MPRTKRTPAQKAKLKRLIKEANEALLNPNSPGWADGARRVLREVARMPHHGRIKQCPFCGQKPTGKKFCDTPNGPALECDSCGCQGPPSNGREQYVFTTTKDYGALQHTAVWVWNWRAAEHEAALARQYFKAGQAMGASFGKQLLKIMKKKGQAKKR